jgi:hypothetical protein
VPRWRSAQRCLSPPRAGIVNGIAADGLVLPRFGVGGVVFLPFVIRWGLWSLAGIGWTRGLILLTLGGPVFSLLQLGGYAYAPLAHGILIMPALARPVHETNFGD